MNFLLHHHLAQRDLAAPAAAVGAMLPDLWRMADRRVRPSAAAPPSGERRSGLDAVLSGIAHHVAADRWFHRDPVFLEGEERTARRLRDARLAAPRIGLFAHVLWELCLDGALLAKVGLFPVLHALREGFGAALGDAADRAADIHHFEPRSRSAEDRAHFGARLGRLCAAIAAGPWIDGYQSGEGIAYRIQGVRARFGMEAMSTDDHARFADACAELLEAAGPVVDRILAAPLPA